MAVFPSVKARELRRVLEGHPFGYRTVTGRGHGSHRLLRSEAGYPELWWAFHDGQTLAPGLVRKILTRDVRLSEEEALALL